MTVTATRAEKDPFRTPNAITVLNLKELERTSAEHGSNLLRDSVGVIAQETTVGQGSPMLRSLTGYQTLVQVDWVRLNNSTFSFGTPINTRQQSHQRCWSAERCYSVQVRCYTEVGQWVALSVSLRNRYRSIQHSKLGTYIHDFLLATRLLHRKN